MLITSIIIIGSVFVYANIGLLIGHLFYKIAHKKIDVPKWIIYALWPIDHHSFEKKRKYDQPLVIKMEEGKYKLAYALGWPVMLFVIKPVLLSLVGAIYLVVSIFVYGIKILTYPLRKVSTINSIDHLSVKDILKE